MSAVVILGLPFHNVSFADTVEWVRQRVRSRRPAYIATVNMDFVTQAWRDPELQRILLEADLVVADGIPIVWLSRLLGHPLKDRVTGSDLVPMFAELAARERFSLFGLGGAPGVAEKAMAILVERYPGFRIAGCHSPPKADILDMDNAGILARIESAAPDILLVAFGAPKQEKWVNLHIRRWDVPVSIGIGGSLDFIAGAQRRAPRWVQRLALEWLWRMLSNPRRLFRRYIANIAFLFAAVFRLLWLRWGPVPSSAKRAATPEDSAAAGEAGARWVAFPTSATACEMAVFRAACEADADRPLVVDMGGREWLDIRDLGKLLDLNRRCRSEHRGLCILAPSPRLAHMLRYVRLDRYLHVAHDMAAALCMLRSTNETRPDGGVKIDPDRRLCVALPAELTAANVAGVRAGVEAAWNKTAEGGEVTGVTVDASGAAFLDSAGLGFLVALRKKALPLPGGFRCAGFRGNARQTLAIARMENLFAADAPGIGGAP
jgi:N-acetylglucosaminyldiphosphoundecaprenol N-acetyl-beta-D-mannosaminyltransferase